MYRESDFADDHVFRRAVDDVLAALLVQLDAVESDEHEARLTSGNLIITFEAGGTFVLSQQTPVRELWLSANQRAWHFVRERGVWVERDSNAPMLETLSRLFSEKMGMATVFEL